MTSSAMSVATPIAEFRAAGTDLSERRRSGVSTGPLIDIAAAPDLTSMHWGADGTLRIGASTTIAAIAADTAIAAAYPGIAAAAFSKSAYRLPEEGRQHLPGPIRQSSLWRRLRPRSLRRAASLDHGGGAAGL